MLIGYSLDKVVNKITCLTNTRVNNDKKIFIHEIVYTVDMENEIAADDLYRKDFHYD